MMGSTSKHGYDGGRQRINTIIAELRHGDSHTRTNCTIIRGARPLNKHGKHWTRYQNVESLCEGLGYAPKGTRLTYNSRPTRHRLLLANSAEKKTQKDSDDNWDLIRCGREARSASVVEEVSIYMHGKAMIWIEREQMA